MKCFNSNQKVICLGCKVEKNRGDFTKKQFVEIILQIALKYTEAKNVVEKKDNPDCETGKEEVGHSNTVLSVLVFSTMIV